MEVYAELYKMNELLEKRITLKGFQEEQKKELKDFVKVNLYIYYNSTNNLAEKERAKQQFLQRKQENEAKLKHMFPKISEKEAEDISSKLNYKLDVIPKEGCQKIRAHILKIEEEREEEEKKKKELKQSEIFFPPQPPTEKRVSRRFISPKKMI